MSLTNAYWTAAKNNSSVKETWLVQLYYGDETNFLGISNKDIDVTLSGTSYHYHALVKDFGNIKESIDLIKCKANIGNVEITCHNRFKNQSFAKELFGGTNYYINRKVDIYSRFADATDLSNCQQIFQGRLYNIIIDEDKLVLQIEHKTPADYIEIPSTRTSEGIYVPVIYGAYSFTASNPTTRAFCHTNILHPLPFIGVFNKEIHCLNHQADTEDNPLFVYEDGWDVFVPLYPDNSNTKTYIDRDGTTFNTIVGPESLRRAFLARPISRDGLTDFEDNPENAIDTNTSTYSQQQDTYDETAGGAASDDLTSYQYFNFANLIGNCTNSTLNIFSVWAKREIYIFATTWTNTTGSATLDFVESHYGSSNNIGSGLTISSVTDDTDLDETSVDLTARFASNNNQWPDKVIIGQAYGYDIVIGSPGHITVFWRSRLYDVYYDFDLEMDLINEFGASMQELEKHKVFYSATDGYDADFTDGSGLVATEIHEIHRDLMDRFTGFDVADASMDGWSALDTSRSGWNARLWLLEPTSIAKVLEQLQYEGCFIFKFKPNGGKYIYIHNSYSSGDVAATLTDTDWKSINLGLTDFQEVITYTTYNFNRHPVDGRYRDKDIYSNSTSRTNYWAAIATQENKRQVNLDYLVNCGDNTESVYDTASSDGDNAINESIAIYQNALIGAPKVLIEIDFGNNKKFNHLEAGDIFQISPVNLDLFGYTASNKYFMITDTERSLSSFRIKGREVQ